MSVLRLIGGIASLIAGGLLLFQVVALFRPVILPTLRQLGEEETIYFNLNIAGFSLTGWRILVFEGILALIGTGLICLSIYAFTSRPSEG